MGHVEFTPTTFANAAYVAGYVRKKVESREDDDYYTRVDPDTGELVQLVPEYARMSRSPAVGLTWLKKYWPEVYPRDQVVVDGHVSKPPRYYDRAFEDPKHDFPGISWEDRMHLMMEVRERRYAEMQTEDPDRLEAKEKVHAARIALYNPRNKL